MSSSRAIRTSGAWTAPRAPTSSICTSWRERAEPPRKKDRRARGARSAAGKAEARLLPRLHLEQVDRQRREDRVRRDASGRAARGPIDDDLVQPAVAPHVHPAMSFVQQRIQPLVQQRDRKSTRLNSSHTVISYAVFCLK